MGTSYMWGKQAPWGRFHREVGDQEKQGQEPCGYLEKSKPSWGSNNLETGMHTKWPSPKFYL